MQKEHIIGENRIYVGENRPEQETDKTPLVLIHGSWAASWMWQVYTPMLTQAGYPVYALDLRGHGKSSGSLEGATMEDFVSDISAVITELGIQRPTIIGHSMGGLIALMYAASADVACFIGIDPSPPLEVMGHGEEKEYPPTYSPVDAGMPADPMEAMKALPDLNQEMLMKMKEQFGMESGVARSQRKRGVSVPKERLTVPAAFIGAELGESVPFGIGSEQAKKCADYYGADFIEVKGATHPGILVGEHAGEAAQAVIDWLAKK